MEYEKHEPFPEALLQGPAIAGELNILIFGMTFPAPEN